MYDIPDELKEERDRLVKMIYEAFDGVTREGGVSWSQADTEYCCSDEEFEAAAKLDTETDWSELVDNEIFSFSAASWSFLDPTGFRYYLAPCMLTCLKSGEDESSLDFHLSYAYQRESAKEHMLEKLSLLNSTQLECVARFVQIMGAWGRAYHETNYPNEWEYALDAYWDKFIPPGTSSIPKFVDQRIFFTLDEL